MAQHTPEGLTLKPFQLKGAQFLADRPRAVLGDEMRLGKTVEAIVACNILKAKKILVVCPATPKLNWQREFSLWSTTPRTYQVVHGTKAIIDPNVDVIIINYDLLIYAAIFDQLVKMRFAVGIFDEIHKLKGKDTKRTKAVFNRGGIASRCAFLWGLTGTFILNRPVEMYPCLKAMAPHVIDPYLSFTAYARHFCGGYFDGIQFHSRGATHVKELSTRLKESGFFLRRTQKEVFDQFTDEIRQLIPVPAVGKHVTELITSELNWEDKDVATRPLEDTEGARISELRHELGDYKVPFAVGHIKDLLECTDKVVVFAYHSSVIDSLLAELESFNPVCIRGGVSSANRQKAVDSFQEDEKCRVFVGQYQAAGEAITLSRGDTIVFVESSWVPGEIDQPSKRCFDFNNPQRLILVQFLTIENSLDETMLNTVIKKKKTINTILNNKDQ
jgi:SWI/SNF-related matrix-associated actin-dependent regulator 1 of chromatin subfamily A